MILPFSTQFKDGTPTNFIEKIWVGLRQKLPATAFMFNDKYVIDYTAKFEMHWDMFWSLTAPNPKYHTIREDAKDRWQPGKKIHMVVFNRTKNQFQFAPVLECKSVQKIEISANPILGVNESVKIDGRIMSTAEVIKLAHNDGFETMEHFFKWFIGDTKDFTGKIIHWTDLKY